MDLNELKENEVIKILKYLREVNKRGEDERKKL